MPIADKYGFFNGIYGIEQSNWANYWKDIIPDGVIADQGAELEVYAVSDGMQVHVKTGQAMVDNHRVWVNAEKLVTIEASDNTYGRIDSIVLRVVYGAMGESAVYVDVKTGTPAATPEAPALMKTTGSTYEMELARVSVVAGAVTIAAGNVTDRRYIFKMPNDGVETFSGTSVTPKTEHEYRNGTAIGSLTVNLPANPHPTYITTVCFTSNASFSGVTVKKGTTTISGTTNLKLKGDVLTVPSKRYNVTFYWDGSYYWAASAAV